MWLYLDLLAAESMVVFFASMFPNFILSLALVAFANGLWMCVGGFLVAPTILNVFWRYVFHYIDYQASRNTYTCGILSHVPANFNDDSATGVRVSRNDGQRIFEAYV